MSDQFGNTVDGEISVPEHQFWIEPAVSRDVYLSAYHDGYRQGQADEHARWSAALDRIIRERA